MTSSLNCITIPIAKSDSIIISITAPVTPVLSISSNQGLTICAGTNIVFSTTSVNAGATPSYQWKINGSTTGSGSTYTTSTLNNGDIITCEMFSSLTCVTNNGIAISNAVQMTVGGNIAPVVQANNCDLAANYISNVSYQWYTNSVVISGAVTRFYTANQTGYYYVVVADSNFCTAQSQDVFIDYPNCSPTGVREITNDLKFEIYELATGSWRLMVGENFIGSEVEVVDAVGRIVLKSTISNQQSEIDARAFASGIYLVRVMNGENKFAVKKMSKN